MDNALFKKLNFKSAEYLLCLNPPESFEVELRDMEKYTEVKRDTKGLKEIPFAIAFGNTQKQLDDYSKAVVPQLMDDGIFWFCYPKKSSKRYSCEFNRDTGWETLGKLDMEPVRMVSIDADWSALRFRQVKHIKKLTRRRSMALTTEAKKRTTNRG